MKYLSLFRFIKIIVLGPREREAYEEPVQHSNSGSVKPCSAERFLVTVGVRCVCLAAVAAVWPCNMGYSFLKLFLPTFKLWCLV